MQDIPVIDVSPLRSDDLGRRIACAALLGKTCRDAGFFHTTGHDILLGVSAGIFTAARTFFTQAGAAP